MKFALVTLSLACAAGLVQAVEKAPTPVGNFSGKVLESTNTAGYTYVLVDTGNKKLWVAAPSFDVKVGSSVTVGDAMPMEKYHSKSMDRDFDVVYFTGSVNVDGASSASGLKASALPKDHPPIGATHPPVSGGATKVDLAGIQKAPGGKTVAEIFAGQSKLGGQQVKVRGKVVKFNANIMGKNWLHLRDGTGAEGSNDLVVTTPSTVKPGDTVLVTGAVSLNKDFGFGYKYAILVEDAKVVAE